MSVLRLAIPTPLRRYFDYLPPAGLDESSVRALQPGIRLRVPFGRRTVTGVLVTVSTDSELPEASLKRALEILDRESLLPPAMLELCHWATGYYHHPPGEVLCAAFPARLRRGNPHRPQGSAGWRLTSRGKGLPAGALARAPAQSRALALLQQEAAVEQLRFRAEGISGAVLGILARKDLAERCMLPAAVRSPVSRGGMKLNGEQARAVEAMEKAAGSFSCHLLEGVTGSGKTEVYLHLIANCLRRAEQALVLIPEIGLTPQTLDRFEERFEAQIVVLHSGLTDVERERAWESARTGHAHIVIGTRSAIFTPMRRLGQIIVDEEHDLSYKQQDGFRYSARDVAVKRGQLENCPVLLGSATPSLESLHNALQGRYQLHPLRQRAGTGTMPVIEVVDIRQKPLQAGLSMPLLTAIEQGSERGEQALLFLNRRGFAPTLQCHDCGWIAQCSACDARLTVHRRNGQLRCHHCAASATLPRQCPDCGSKQLLTTGLGTEQTEDFLRSRFPRVPVFRVDSDSMQRKSAMRDLIGNLQQGEPCILLGTQMLTKGHHFPAVGLVAVIDADAMLFSTDFRGEERMAQLLTQVTGRAGRADLPGRVLLQTHYPDHPAMQSVLTESYATRARELLAGRQATALPPVGHLALVRTDCADAGAGEQFLHQLREQLEPQLPRHCRLIGPLPSPMQRRAGKFRFQLLLTAPNRPAAQGAATLIAAIGEALSARRGLTWSLDIDPQDLF
jgi:primosomal protein N' (replication factor Y)